MCDTFCSVLQLAALLVVHLIYTYPLSPHLYPAVHFMHVFNLHFLGNTRTPEHAGILDTDMQAMFDNLRMESTIHGEGIWSKYYTTSLACLFWTERSTIKSASIKIWTRISLIINHVHTFLVQ